MRERNCWYLQTSTALRNVLPTSSVRSNSFANELPLHAFCMPVDHLDQLVLVERIRVAVVRNLLANFHDVERFKFTILRPTLNRDISSNWVYIRFSNCMMLSDKSTSLFCQRPLNEASEKKS